MTSRCPSRVEDDPRPRPPEGLGFIFGGVIRFASLAAYLLGEASADACDERSWPYSQRRLTRLAQALDANPDLLEDAWNIWTWEMDGWSEAAIMEARYWVDAVLIGGLPVPE